MKVEVFVLLMTIVTALSSTNVNISFSQKHSRTGLKMPELQNGQTQFKVTNYSEQYNSDNTNSRFARIQFDDKKSKAEVDGIQKVVSDMKAKLDAAADHRSERVYSKEMDGFFGSHSQNQQRTLYNSNREVQKIHGQFRNLSQQDKQNMEFERYINSYHSSPTVETVYESAKPEIQHTLEASPVQERPQRVVKFERQVALRTKADSVQPLHDANKPTHHKTVTPSNTKSLDSTDSSASTSPSSLSPVAPNLSVSSTSGNNFKVILNQKPSSAGKDGFDFDLNYNKPNYNDRTLKYGDESHFYNQYPPSLEENHNGYGDYYNNIYSRQQGVEDFNINEQQPVVTKTIQIAQPAIKAKKYEVRHPAIQKEFYDVEERVVIKPAGTVVVELERPSAKILKEETTLPLGHPHPAVAAQYMQNRNTQTFSNIIYSNSRSSSENRPNGQYIPHQNYNNKNLQDHLSAISSPGSPTYDETSKDISVDTNHNTAFVGDHYSASSSADSPKPQNRETVVLTDGHGNQRQLSTDQFTYTRDETNKSPSITIHNRRNPYVYENNGRSNSQSNIAPKRPSFQSNEDNGEEFTFDAEYISSSGDSNMRKEKKPARLQEALLERVIEPKQQPQPIIKHEHKIVLSPSQHNIYLSRNHEVPKTKFIEETAEVREIKPYLQNQREPVVAYAPELKYGQRSDYKTAARALLRGMQYGNSAQGSHVSGNDNRVHYSAPYTQMRLHTDHQSQNEQQQKDIPSQHKLEKLILADKAEAKQSSNLNSMEKEASHAHIEIKIPNMSSDNVNKAVFVSSTIKPMMIDDGSSESHNSKFEISVTNNGEPKKEKSFESEIDTNDQINNDNKNLSEKDSEHLSEKKHPDCDQIPKSKSSENYELAPENNYSRQQKFLRIVEASSAASSSHAEAAVASNVQPHHVDVSVKSSSGHLNPAGSRVIASTAAPKESSPSESFHKRRIVVNHPFQTVREVVEHEPYTNYHEVQVQEPATPALYHSANYYQSLGALRQSGTRKSPTY